MYDSLPHSRRYGPQSIAPGGAQEIAAMPRQGDMGEMPGASHLLEEGFQAQTCVFCRSAALRGSSGNAADFERHEVCATHNSLFTIH